MTAGFKTRKNAKKYPECGFHLGVDFATTAGNLVVAARGGEVRWVNFGRDYGSAQMAVLCEDGTMDFYGHLAGRIAGHEVQVRAGDTLGMSSDGHLHFQRQAIWGQADWCDNAVDPHPSLEAEV
jgi:murein DD-endopeptidase MepM/ murein hydrolase activator NlpD